MALIIVLIAAAAAVALIYLTASPFLSSRSEQARVDLLEAEIREVELLAARKATLLNSLRELEFDHQLNKISDEDYERFRTRYERQAVGVMRELDAVHGGRGWQQTIEAEIAARLGAEPDIEEPADKPAIDSNDTPQADSDLSCAACGNTLEPDDKFCSECGERVRELRPLTEASA
ncbi:MAG: zinc ribbon domain-containing protein [bacterium]